MASFASEVTITQSESFFSRFGRFGGNMRLLKKLLADDERMEVWVKSLLDIASPEHLTAYISYQRPPYEELNGIRFDWASHLFSSRYKWEEHESVRGQVDRAPGNRDFLVKEFTREEKRQRGSLTSDHVIDWAATNGYRAPVLEETVDFAKAYPNLQREYPIVALGSFAWMSNGHRNVAVLTRGGAGRDLADYWIGGGWHTNYRFLLVRK